MQRLTEVNIGLHWLTEVNRGKQMLTEVNIGLHWLTEVNRG